MLNQHKIRATSARAVMVTVVALVATNPTAQAENNVAARLITFTGAAAVPNGAWSWFSSPRAIVDDNVAGGPRILVSSVSAAADGSPESGDIDVHWYDVGSGAQGSVELHDRLERDDHNNAALLLRPDGRYLAVYARHGTDHLTRFRISIDPHDPTAWQAEQTFDNGTGTTYSNIHRIARDDAGAGRTYNFTRSKNWDPNILMSSDSGTRWTDAGKLLTEGDHRSRPYVRYVSDSERIHFITTEQHPRNFDNSVYHGYVQDAQLFDSRGTVVDGSLFDAQAVRPSTLTPVFRTGTTLDGTAMRRAWTIDMAIDGDGRPVAVFQARADDQADDHRFFYARFDGQQWRVHPIAKAGGYLYDSEQDYTGLVAIDPDAPETLYLSTEIDPRDGSALPKYEIFQAITSDGGTRWRFTPITWNSTMDNLRPIVPAWQGPQTALLWMRGTYATYRQWDTAVVGVILGAAAP